MRSHPHARHRLALTLLALVAILGWRCRPAPPETILRESIQVDFLQDPGALEPLASPKGQRPAVEEIRMRMTAVRTSGITATALVLTPGTKLAFEHLPAADGESSPLRLHCRAAIDQRSHRAVARTETGGQLELRISVDDVPLRSEVFDVGLPDADEHSRLVAEDDQVLVPPGSRLTLEVLWRGDRPPRPIPRLGLVELILSAARPVPLLRSSPDAPNLILVVQDTLRADRTDPHGYVRSTTPRLSGLVDRGTSYSAAYSTASWTWPSTASILTGLPAEAHGVRGPLACHLAGGIESLPEALAAHGYLCAAWVGNTIVSREHGFAQGFHEFHHRSRGFRFTVEMIDEIEAWIEAHGDQRFFLYLHIVDPHAPYGNTDEAQARLAPERGLSNRLIVEWEAKLRASMKDGTRAETEPTPEEQAWISENYDAAVATADTYLGRVLDALDRHGLTDRSIVAVTSDHGEELYDHGLYLHGHSLHTELVQVPLVLAGPGVPRGERRPVPVSNRHVATTLARLGGVRLEQVDDPLDLALEAPPEDRPVLSSTHWGLELDGSKARFQVRLRRGRWVVIADLEKQPRVLALFDAELDPAQVRDVAELHPDLAEELLEEALTLARTQFESAPAARPGSADTMRMLRALGYLDADDR